MSGGSMDYLYIRVEDATFKTNSPERKAFRRHLMRVAKALRSIEWNDSGDGDDAEDENIKACISQTAVIMELIDEASKVHRELAQAIVRAKGINKEDGR